jgi:hypothetical protein
MTDDADTAQSTESAEATWEQVKQREQRKRQATKEIVLEYPDGLTARFEFQMVEDVGAIADRHTSKKPTRSGQDPEYEMDEDDEWAFAAELFQEAIVAAPEGFKPTEQELRTGLTKPVVDDMVESITNFSTIDEETYIKFR